MARLRLTILLPVGVSIYLLLTALAGVFLAEGTLHPGRRPLESRPALVLANLAKKDSYHSQAVTIAAADGVRLSAWYISQANERDAVILLHGMSDNRAGMAGYAGLFLKDGYNVLMPDARAHGDSGGTLATYGLLERKDIERWFEWVQRTTHPHCIYGFGESMGAAQLLQSVALDSHFCAVAAESSFATFREIAYDRVGQPLHLGPWFGRTILRPTVETAFIYARLKYGLDIEKVSPEKAVEQSSVPVLLIHGVVDGNIPIRHAEMIKAHDPKVKLWEVPNADHCGASSAAPEQFESKVIGWFRAHGE